MRQTQATLRHRGVYMTNAAFEAVDEYVVGRGEVMVLDEIGDVWLNRLAFVATLVQATGVAMVTVPGIDLDYTFEIER
jgi:hypothetical protein